MDLHLLGVVSGSVVCAALFTLQKPTMLEALLSKERGVEEENVNGTSPEMSSSSAAAAASADAADTTGRGVKATPELEDFLENIGQLQLLEPLTEWGAKHPSDLKWLRDEDYVELGVPAEMIREAVEKEELTVT